MRRASRSASPRRASCWRRPITPSACSTSWAVSAPMPPATPSHQPWAARLPPRRRHRRDAARRRHAAIGVPLPAARLGRRGDDERADGPRGRRAVGGIRQGLLRPARRGVPRHRAARAPPRRAGSGGPRQDRRRPSAAAPRRAPPSPIGARESPPASAAPALRASRRCDASAFATSPTRRCSPNGTSGSTRRSAGSGSDRRQTNIGFTGDLHDRRSFA